MLKNARVYLYFYYLFQFSALIFLSDESITIVFDELIVKYGKVDWG